MSLSVLTIGAGFFASLHVDAWARNGDVTFAGLVDPDLDKAEKLRDEHCPEALVFEDPMEALSELNPDIIDIATPPSTHADLISLADRSNPKAIICQKPFCGTYEAAQKAVASTSSLLIVHENFRFQPWYRILKDNLEKDAIGEVFQVTVRLRPGDGQGPEAYLARQPYFQEMERFLIHETGIHFIDCFRYFLGEPNSVFADLRRLNPAIKGEDACHLTLQYDSGARAVLDGNRLADHAADNLRLTMGECMIEGSKGVLTVDGFGKVWKRDFGSPQAVEIKHEFNGTRFGGDCVFRFQKHVTDHLLTGSPLENTGQAYLRNMEIEEAVYASNSQKSVISL